MRGPRLSYLRTIARRDTGGLQTLRPPNPLLRRWEMTDAVAPTAAQTTVAKPIENAGNRATQYEQSKLSNSTEPAAMPVSSAIAPPVESKIIQRQTSSVDAPVVTRPLSPATANVQTAKEVKPASPQSPSLTDTWLNRKTPVTDEMRFQALPEAIRPGSVSPDAPLRTPALAPQAKVSGLADKGDSVGVDRTHQQSNAQSTSAVGIKGPREVVTAKPLPTETGFEPPVIRQRQPLEAPRPNGSEARIASGISRPSRDPRRESAEATPVVNIGSIDVRIVPAPVNTVRQAQLRSAAKTASHLSRGFTSTLGIRQG
jgi:hypothetical protein